MVSPVLVAPADDSSISEFLEGCKPSSNHMSVQSGGWVLLPRAGDDSKDSGKSAEDAGGHEAFEAAGQALVQDLTSACGRIKAEAPVRANKKQGIRSQKDLREEKHAEFNASVKALAIQHGVVSGKWLFYGNAESIDGTWAKIVKALAKSDGPLARTGHVHCAKVASALEPGRGDSYVICVYCDDSFDKTAVKEVFEALVGDLQMVSSAYKADANTILGIDSKHSSGIKSSLYGKGDMMTQPEIEQALGATTRARPTQQKTLADEEAEGGGFAPVSDSEDDEPPKKKVKG